MLGVAYQTVERWEHNRNPISPKSRLKIVTFIGYDPEATADETNR
jgi:DNA-binding transcriptional regulator YiaG